MKHNHKGCTELGEVQYLLRANAVFKSFDWVGNLSNDYFLTKFAPAPILPISP